MKKMLSTILAIVMVLSLSTTAFAYDESTYSGDGQTELTASAYSTYTVTIPASINLTNSQGDISITDANIADGYEIEIVATNLNASGGIDMALIT